MWTSKRQKMAFSIGFKIYWFLSYYTATLFFITSQCNGFNLTSNAFTRGTNGEIGGATCTSSVKYVKFVQAIDDVEDLKLNVPIHIAFDYRQKKRFLLLLESPSPLSISFSQDAARNIFFNATPHLSRTVRPSYQDQRLMLFPCALSGQYDLFVQARQRGSIKIEAVGVHPQLAYWPLLNHTSRIRLRTQNRIGKGQMIVKWHKSKLDVHAVHYCLVISAKTPHKNFCEAVQEHVTHKKGNCYPSSLMDLIWQRPAERVRKIDARFTTIACTGSRTRQQFNGLIAQQTYYLDLFGVHTRRQNFTFHLASSRVNFNRTHPLILRPNVLRVEKISGSHGIQVFSFKVPSSPSTRSLDFDSPTNNLNLRYLILPCSGSEVNAKFLKRRNEVGTVQSIYAPTYVRIPEVKVGERYMVRFSPSNEDETLRANKVGLAVTTRGIFSYLPELPSNVSVFEVRSDCQSSTVAWYSAPDNRTMRYCIIVFNLPQRNRSAVDYTNYCLDFGKRITRHPQFHSVDCIEKVKSTPTLETHTINNLNAGESFLVYVTANLNDGKPLPYQSLTVRTSYQCVNNNNSKELGTYY